MISFVESRAEGIDFGAHTARLLVRKDEGHRKLRRSPPGSWKSDGVNGRLKSRSDISHPPPHSYRSSTVELIVPGLVAQSNWSNKSPTGRAPWPAFLRWQFLVVSVSFPRAAVPKKSGSSCCIPRRSNASEMLPSADPATARQGERVNRFDPVLAILGGLDDLVFLARKVDPEPAVMPGRSQF